MLFIILLVLFVSLLIIVPLVERYGKRYSPEDLRKLTKWFFPLLLLLMIAQAVRYFF
jgi:cytochrome c-type biogenesis protein CcmH/NrfF